MPTSPLFPVLDPAQGASPFAATGSVLAASRPNPEYDVRDPELNIRDEEDGGLRFFDLDDALAPLRGIEGLVRSIGDLGNLIPGVDVDFSSRRSLLGRSDTLVGGFLESAVQFLIPFGATTKALSGIGFLGRGLATAQGAAAAARTARLGLAGRSLARGAVAGAGADFIAFSGTEERLSNLLVQVPGLANPVTEYLAAGPDEGEAEGRLKNVLEGLGLGVLTDGLVQAFRSTRAYRRALADGATTDEAVQAALDAAPKEAQLEAIREEVAKLEESGELPPGLASAVDPADPDGVVEEVAAARLSKDEIEALRARQAEAKEFQNKRRPKGPEPTERPGRFSPLNEAIRELRTPEEVSARIEERLGLSPEEGQLALDAYERIVSERSVSSKQYRELIGNPRETPTAIKKLLGLAEVGRLNLQTLGIEGDGVAAIRALEEIIAPLLRGQRKETLEEATLRALPVSAELASLSLPNLALKLLRDRKDVIRAQSTGIATKILLQAETPRVLELFRKGLETGDLSGGLEAFARVGRISEGAREIYEEFGRGLRFARIPTDLLDLGSDIARAAEEGRLGTKVGREELLKRVRQLEHLQKYPDDVQQTVLARWAQMDFLERGIAVINEVVISNLLSSVKTLTTNGIFPLLQSLYIPLENILGGGITSVVGKATGNAQKAAAGQTVIRRELNALAGMFKSISDSAHFARRAFQENREIISADGRELPQTSLLRSAFLLPGRPKENRYAKIVDGIGKFISFPTPVMKGTDEFIRQMSARGYIYGEQMAKFLDEGLPHAEAVARAEEALDKAFLEGQLITERTIGKEAIRRAEAKGAKNSAVNVSEANQYREAVSREVDALRRERDFSTLEPVTQSALKRAGESTSTLPLEPGTVFHSVEEMTRRHPVFRIVMPFVRTPANLAKFTGQRFDVIGSYVEKSLRTNFGRQSVEIEKLRFRNARALASGDPQEIAELTGRLTSGAAFLTVGFTAAYSGVVTGGGPEDPELRKALLATGWQPYSIRTENGYVQYLRADPFASMIGMSADLVEALRMADPTEDPAVTAVASAMLMTVSRNLLNKTYLSGVRSFVDAVTRGDRFAGNFVEGLATLPIPRSIQSLTTVTDDPVMRDAHGILQTIRSRTPFFSSSIPPQRDLFGKPILRSLAAVPGSEQGDLASRWGDLFLPIAYREVDDGVVASELRRLQHGFTPPTRERFGLRLDEYRKADGQDAYDRWAELQGEVKIQGKTLQKALRELIRSREYRDLPDIPGLFDERPQVRALQGVVRRYRAAAWEKTVDEYRDLGRDLRTVINTRDRALTGQRVPEDPLARLGI